MMWTAFSFASVFTNKCPPQPPPFFFFSFTYPSEGLTSCMPVGHSSEGVQAGELWQRGGFSARTSNCVAWRLSPVVQHLRRDVAGWQAVNSTSCMGLPPWGKSWGAPRWGWGIWSETVVKLTEQETCMKHKIWKISAYTKRNFPTACLSWSKQLSCWQESAVAARSGTESSRRYPDPRKHGAVCAVACPSSTLQLTPAHTTVLEKFLYVCSTNHGGGFLHLFWHFLWATVGTY